MRGNAPDKSKNTCEMLHCPCELNLKKPGCVFRNQSRFCCRCNVPSSQNVVNLPNAWKRDLAGLGEDRAREMGEWRWVVGQDQ